MIKENKLRLLEDLKCITRRVNSTLNHYEDDYMSASRTPNISEKEDCKSFSDFVEIRFNRECLESDLFKEAVELAKGHLFICQYLNNIDLVERSFDEGCITLLSEETIDKEVDKLILSIEDIKAEDLEKYKKKNTDLIKSLISEMLEGVSLARKVMEEFTSIHFNSVPKKVRLTID